MVAAASVVNSNWLLAHLSSYALWLRSSTTVPTLALTLLLVALLACAIPWLLDARRRIPNEPPLVPSYLPFIHSGLAFAAHPHRFLSKCREKYGDVFLVRLGPKRMIILSSPTMYPHLFKNKQLSFSKVADAVARDVLSQTPASINVPEIDKLVHQQYAKHLQGTGLDDLTKKAYVEIRQWMRRDQARLAEKGLKMQSTRGLFQLINDIVFDSGARAVYGSGLQLDDLQRIFTDFDKAFPLLMTQVPNFIVAKAVRARAELIRRLSSTKPLEGESHIIKARRTMFIDHPHVYSPHDVGATNMAFLWAAVANTNPAAFHTMAYLLKHPKAFAAVKAELLEHLPFVPLRKGDDMQWTREQCAKLKLTESAIFEALRLTTGSMVVREALEDVQLQLADRVVGVRKGDSVALFPALSHLDAKYFPNPESYQFDRFVDGETKLGFLPFGGGVSYCPGRKFAQNEIMMIMALLFQHCDIKLHDENAPLVTMDYSRVGIGVFGANGDYELDVRYTDLA